MLMKLLPIKFSLISLILSVVVFGGSTVARAMTKAEEEYGDVTVATLHATSLLRSVRAQSEIGQFTEAPAKETAGKQRTQRRD